ARPRRQRRGLAQEPPHRAEAHRALTATPCDVLDGHPAEPRLDVNRACYVISSSMNAARHDHPKLSRNQGQVLAALRKAKEPLSAYAILDRVRISGISHPPTVYRALNELIGLGLVHRLQSRSAFVACDHGACNGKAAFAICRECEKVVEISLSDKDERVLLALSPKGIAPENVTLEIAGLCEACRPA